MLYFSYAAYALADLEKFLAEVGIAITGLSNDGVHSSLDSDRRSANVFWTAVLQNDCCG